MSAKLKKTDRISYQIAAALPLMLCLVFVFLPIAMVVSSLKTDYDIMAGIFTVPQRLHFEGYAIAWGEVLRPMLNSIVVALVGAFFNMVLAAVIAYIFARKQFLFKEVFFMMYIAILLVPAVMGMPVLYDFASRVGLVDSYFGIWLPVIAGGQAGALFLFRTFFQQQPDSVYESAKMDGANDASVFVFIVVPLALPILLLNFTGTFVAQYNDFLWPSLVLKSQEKLTLIPILQRMSARYVTRNLSVPYAVYVMAALPLTVTTVLTLKYFQGGDFAAGMKL